MMAGNTDSFSRVRVTLQLAYQASLMKVLFQDTFLRINAAKILFHVFIAVHNKLGSTLYITLE